MARDRYGHPGKLQKKKVRATEGGRVSSTPKTYRCRIGTRNALAERVFTDAAGARRHAQSALLDLQVYCQRHNSPGLEEIASARARIETWNGDAPREIDFVYDDRMPPYLVILDRV